MKKLMPLLLIAMMTGCSGATVSYDRATGALAGAGPDVQIPASTVEVLEFYRENSEAYKAYYEQAPMLEFKLDNTGRVAGITFNPQREAPRITRYPRNSEMVVEGLKAVVPPVIRGAVGITGAIVAGDVLKKAFSRAAGNTTTTTTTTTTTNDNRSTDTRTSTVNANDNSTTTTTNTTNTSTENYTETNNTENTTNTTNNTTTTQNTSNITEDNRVTVTDNSDNSTTDNSVTVTDNSVTDNSVTDNRVTDNSDNSVNN